MLARDLLRTKGAAVVTVTGATPVHHALGAFKQYNLGALVVSPNGRELDGVISERDIIRALADLGASALEQSVEDIMAPNTFFCSPTTTVEELMATMTERRVRHVPVLDHGVLVGIVSIGDVVKSRMVELAAETDTIREYIWYGR